MNLEAQLAGLADLGLPLAAGRTVDELLYSWPRESYEDKPFDVLLYVLGCEVEAEPWGRRFCDRAWHFDTECVRGAGSYVAIVGQLCRTAGRQDALTDVRDHVDLGAEEAWIEYRAGGRERRWDIEVRDDWADLMTVGYVMDDLEGDGHRFYARRNGQAMTLYFLTEAEADRLNGLVGERLVTPFLG
ncbi:hypothetical protein [Streptomyces sp. NPDC050504]|uniref:hypothetical protein n=1 Tax=Streptomyces sp. NPDC050504 TaxID=3365618 RepID=UPI00379D01F4